jgi:hypothetical protein
MGYKNNVTLGPKRTDTEQGGCLGPVVATFFHSKSKSAKPVLKHVRDLQNTRT